MSEDFYITPEQAAVIYGVSTSSVYELVAQYRLKAHRFVGRPINPAGIGKPLVAYLKSDLEAAMEKDSLWRLGDHAGGQAPAWGPLSSEPGKPPDKR